MYNPVPLPMHETPRVAFQPSLCTADMCSLQDQEFLSSFISQNFELGEGVSSSSGSHWGRDLLIKYLLLTRPRAKVLLKLFFN